VIAATARQSVIAVGTLFFFNGALFGAWASRVPTVKAQYSLSEAALGTLLLLLAGGAVVSFPVAGRVIDRLGCSIVAIALAMLNAVALIAIGASVNVTTVAIALTLFGASHGGMDVAMNAWAGMVEQRHNIRVMSRLHAVWSLGAGVGALSGVVAGKLSVGLLLHFFIIALCMVVLAALLTRPEARPATSSTSGAPFALPRGTLLWVGIIAFCASMGEGAMADWSAVYLNTAWQTSAAIAASGYAVFSVAMVITRLCGDWIIRSFGERRSLLMAGICATAGTSALTLAGQLPVVFTGFVLMGAGYALVMPIAFSRAANDPYISAGSATAATATLGYGGLLLGPPLIGFIANATSLKQAFMVLLLGGATILLLSKAATGTER
jgi:MFS family permease